METKQLFHSLLYTVVLLFIESSCDRLDNDVDIINLHTNVAFHTKYWLNKSSKNVDNLELLSSITGFPDLPSWMLFYRKKHSPFGYFYGTPTNDDDGDIEIEIILVDTFNYNTTKDRLKYRILNSEDQFKYEVEIKFFEVDLQDFFEKNLSSTIQQVFNNTLWKSDNPVNVTLVARPNDVGFRYPLDPKEKEGVVVRLGSASNFTEDLFRLESEVKKMKNRNPCPKRYKATTAEYLFREINLRVDWCNFGLRIF